MKKENKNIIIVNKFSVDSCKTIQEAINIATPYNTIIKISAGYYSKFIINKPGLIIEALNPKENVIIVVDKEENVLIDYKEEGITLLKNLKFGHTSSEMNLNFNKVVKSLLASNKTRRSMNLKNFQNIARFYQPKSYTSTLMKIRKGYVICNKCLFSFKLLTKAIENSNIGIIVEEGNSVKLVNCEIVGHENYTSIGILLQRANLILINCKIYNHLNGGISVFLENDNILEISNSVIVNNSFGVDIMGIEGKVFFNDNKILFNKKEGIRVGISINAFLVKNEITHNNIGVYLISCAAKLINNTIKKNKKFGIHSVTTENLLNNSEIKMNTILLNEDSGICIEGKNNKTFIKSNLKICENKGCGIILKNHSNCRIINNFIFNNNKQGILIEETSVAKILYNSIYKNIKANIALGGSKSSDNLIMHNKIYKSTSEGIFLMNSGNVIIYNNCIYQNYEGIVVYEGSADISFNEIYKNVTNGISVMKNSKPFLRNNRIFLNQGIGVFVRDISVPAFFENHLEKNEVDFVSENSEVDFGVLEKGKSLGGNFLFLKNKVCVIF